MFPARVVIFMHILANVSSVCTQAEIDSKGQPQFHGGFASECGIFDMGSYLVPGGLSYTFLFWGYCDDGAGTDFGFAAFSTYEFSNFGTLFKFDGYSKAVACDKE